ncbi:uncharacterized protein [Nicotiana tomentosiformis]|uniref:uncharacterized protein n=1 Tax=Nicotiana tomentosiformis TaxID=4098 RepID=UPI00388C7DCA
MAPYEALYERRCRSPVRWSEVSETELHGPDLFHQAIEKVVPIKDVQVTEDLSYKEVPVAILDRPVRKLRTKDVPSIKVLWRNKNTEEMTWEAEEEMKSKYPYLFQIEDNEDAGGTQDTLEGETAL